VRMAGKRRLLTATLAAAVVALVCPAALAAPLAAQARHAAGTKQVAFSGHYTGLASLLINNGAVTISSVKGKGSATLVGASSLGGKGSASASAQCDPFGGLGSISGAKGKIDISVASSTSRGCSSGESGPVTVSFHGIAKATGGTGDAAGAAGSLKFSGTLKLGGTSGHQSGSFSATLTGKLTIKD